MLCVISVAVFVDCISIVLVVVVGNMLHAIDICKAIWYRDRIWFIHLYLDCYPELPVDDANMAYKIACENIPARLARVSRQGPSRPRSDISVGPRAVKRESEQLTLPL